MERWMKVMKLRMEGLLPEDIDNKLGPENLEIKDKIKKLVSKDPKDRPKAEIYLEEY